MRSDRGGRSPSLDELYPEVREAGIDRKTLQLCKQVQRVLATVLGGEIADEALQSLMVDAVEPAPSAGRLRVVLLASSSAWSESELRERLERAQGWLRAQVAQAVNRKRAPELAFEVVLLSAGTP
jgi:ribosome-binding factor A